MITVTMTGKRLKRMAAFKCLMINLAPVDRALGKVEAISTEIHCLLRKRNRSQSDGHARRLSHAQSPVQHAKRLVVRNILVAPSALFRPELVNAPSLILLRIGSLELIKHLLQ
jgi:hypothetical protein